MTEPTQGPAGHPPVGQPQPVQWQPDPGWHDSHPPTPLPPKKKSYAVVWLAAGMAVLLIVAVGLAGRSARQQATGAGTSSSAGTATTTTTTTRTTTTTTTTTTRPKLPPSVFRGSGDDVVSLDRPPGLKVVKFECPACTRNTVVKTNGFESLLVNEIGAYSGQKWMDIRDGSRTTSVTIS